MIRHPVLYSRELPGGGFVVIDARASGAQHHARLWVERRADPLRRAGHVPPVIAQLTGPDLDQAVAELRTIAGDNVTLALAIRRWVQARRAAS